jgi:hypothetical protein
MTGPNCRLFTHNQSRSYLNHLVFQQKVPIKTYPPTTLHVRFNSTQQDPSQHYTSSPGQEIPCCLQKPKLFNVFIRTPLLASYSEPHEPSQHLPTLLIIFILAVLRQRLQSGIFHSGSPNKILYALLHDPIHATWPSHPELLTPVCGDA